MSDSEQPRKQVLLKVIMGSNLSRSAADDAKVEAVMEAIQRKCDSYLDFCELTTAELDLDITDLDQELTEIIEMFLPDVVPLHPSVSQSMISDVQKYSNFHKLAIRLMFEYLSDAQDEFAVMAHLITGDDVDEDIDEIDFENAIEDEESDEDQLAEEAFLQALENGEDTVDDFDGESDANDDESV